MSEEEVIATEISTPSKVTRKKQQHKMHRGKVSPVGFQLMNENNQLSTLISASQPESIETNGSASVMHSNEKTDEVHR